MTIRNLDALFAPESVALIGASSRPGTIGNTITRNLLAGTFRNRVQLVNLRHTEIEGHPSYASIAQLPICPTLAVVATPPATIPGVIADLAGRGTRAAVVITAGLDAALKQAMLDASRPNLLRILGPNGIGLMLPRLGLNATFAHRAALPGDLALISQSGALVTAMVDWASSRAIGFSHVISIGDMADVDFGDLLDYLAGDVQSRAILLYVEALTNAPKFMSAARRAARAKPVVLVKSGRHAVAARAAASHTGRLASSDAVYDAAFRRAGVLRVFDLKELFDAAETLARVPRLKGERLMIVTNGGGAGVLAADRLADFGGQITELPEDLLRDLDGVLPPTWSHGDPIDIIGDADEERYSAVVSRVLGHADTDAVLVIHCPTALSSSAAVARTVTEIVSADRRAKGADSPAVLTNWLGEDAALEARATFARAGIASYDTPGTAARAFMHLVRHRRTQDALLRTPPVLPAGVDGRTAPDPAAAAALLARVLADGRSMLSEAEGKDLLATYGVPIAPSRVAASETEAGTAARELLGAHPAVVLKILSDDITHKSDVGGVALDLASPDAVVAEAQAMRERVRAAKPDARIKGFTVSPMIRRPNAHELIVGVSVDPTFGPMLLFGAGGIAVEAMHDTALAMPPLDMQLALDLIQETRIARLLAGYRHRPPADLSAIAATLVRVGALVAAHPEIRELDINPLLADDAGVVAVDARVRIADPATHPRVPMAIKPYPAEWERHLDLGAIGPTLVRPIRPEDETLYAEFLSHVSSADMRLRFLAPTKQLSHRFIARLTQIDYAREMAFVAIRRSDGALLGIARYFCDPDIVRAEYAILVRSDLKGKGLGWQLMQTLIDHARSIGLKQLHGDVLTDNESMIAMCRELGFAIVADREDPSLKQVVLNL